MQTSRVPQTSRTLGEMSRFTCTVLLLNACANQEQPASEWKSLADASTHDGRSDDASQDEGSSESIADASTPSNKGDEADANDSPAVDSGTEERREEPRCDFIEACRELTGPCFIGYGTACGESKMGSYGCGNEDELQQGFVFDDGWSSPCETSGPALDCAGASMAASQRCYDLSVKP